MLTTCQCCHTATLFRHYLVFVITRGQVDRNEAEEYLVFRDRPRAHPHLGIEKGGSTTVTKFLYSLFQSPFLLSANFQGTHCCFPGNRFLQSVLKNPGPRFKVRVEEEANVWRTDWFLANPLLDLCCTVASSKCSKIIREEGSLKIINLEFLFICLLA